MTRIARPGAGDLEIDVLTSGRVALVRVAGELTAESAPDLITTRDTAVRNGTCDLVLDLGSLVFCDAGGLRALLLMGRAVEGRGTCTLVRPRPVVVDLLDRSGARSHFTILEPDGQVP